ncbi:MAG: hypothetical protein JNL40_09370 [Cyclobacteriaceae bacterium]|nr:hypothetical protein [Cyclobacteriaceae bacterium]
MRIARIIVFLVLIGGPSQAQLPIEILGGHQRTTADVLWFRPFKDSLGNSSRFLFFNRSRASVDYSNQTTFGTTLAVSYNLPSGWGVVLSGQFFNNGFSPKAGVQYFKRSRQLMVFSWVTAELLQSKKLDWFLLSRWEPRLNRRLNLFSQLELLSTTDWDGNLALIQRLRAGLGFPLGWQTGLGMDFGQVGKSSFITSSNIGIFIRKDF